MALTGPTQTVVDNILSSVADELAAEYDADFVSDRPAMNIRDRIVEAVDHAIAQTDFSTITNPGAN